MRASAPSHTREPDSTRLTRVFSGSIQWQPPLHCGLLSAIGEIRTPTPFGTASSRRHVCHSITIAEMMRSTNASASASQGATLTVPGQPNLGLTDASQSRYLVTWHLGPSCAPQESNLPSQRPRGYSPLRQTNSPLTRELRKESMDTSVPGATRASWPAVKPYWGHHCEGSSHCRSLLGFFQRLHRCTSLAGVLRIGYRWHTLCCPASHIVAQVALRSASAP